MVDIRSFDGAPEELTNFLCNVWRTAGEGRIVTPLWSGEYLNWQFFDNPHVEPDYIVVAYDRDRIVGAFLAIDGRFRAGDVIFRGSWGSWLTVAAAIGGVDLASWEYVRSYCRTSVFMDRRFIAAVECSMKQSCQFWHVIIYDEDALPVACASLSTITIDLLDTADTSLAFAVRYLPGVQRALSRIKLLLCGLPISAGQSSLALISPDSSPEILSTLDAAISELAEKMRVHLIAYKEFGKDDLEWLNPLLKLGYRCIQSVAMNSFKGSFQDLQYYCAALRSHYRFKVNKSLRKLTRMNIQTSVLTDPEEIISVYTPEVHDLYLQTLEKAEVKLEKLPMEFFHQLASHLQGQVDLVVLTNDARIVAFSWCLRDNTVYHMLYVGIDYALNSTGDLYFNVMYASLDRALRQKPTKIQLGQTASIFKARLGCYSEPLCIFVKGYGPFMSALVHHAGHLLVARETAPPIFNTFKTGISQLPL
jgi:hypothetical protein